MFKSSSITSTFCTVTPYLNFGTRPRSISTLTEMAHLKKEEKQMPENFYLTSASKLSKSKHTPGRKESHLETHVLASTKSQCDKDLNLSYRQYRTCFNVLTAKQSTLPKPCTTENNCPKLLHLGQLWFSRIYPLKANQSWFLYFVISFCVKCISKLKSSGSAEVKTSQHSWSVTTHKPQDRWLTAAINNQFYILSFRSDLKTPNLSHCCRSDCKAGDYLISNQDFQSGLAVSIHIPKKLLSSRNYQHEAKIFLTGHGHTVQLMQFQDILNLFFTLSLILR